MPVPRFRSVAAAFASRRFEEVGVRSAEAPHSPSPGSAERPEPFIVPLGRFEADANARSSPPGPARKDCASRERVPSQSADPGKPDRHSARTRRNRKANLTIVPHPLREPQIEANPDPSARRTFDEKQAPRPDPFAASNRSKLRSFRRRAFDMEASLPSRPVGSLGSRRTLILPLPDLATRSEPLVLDPSRRQRGASSVSSPPDLPPKRERSNIRPVRGIDRRRTSCLLPPGHPPEGKPPNLDPSQPRSGASPVLDRRTAWEPKSPHDPHSRTFQIEANPDPSSRRT